MKKIWAVLLVAALLFLSVGCGEEPLPQSPVDVGTPGLSYELLDDGTYGVRVGEATQVAEVVIPAAYNGIAVTRILPNAFGSHTAENRTLQKITVPDSVTHVESRAFSLCVALREVVLGTGLRQIEDWAFYGCSALTVLTLPHGLEHIGISAFSFCNGLVALSLPETLQTVGGSAFAGCEGLQAVTLPAKVEQLGDWAFYECKSLTEVTVLAGAATFGFDAFWGCDRLSAVQIADLVAWCGNSFESAQSNPLYLAGSLYVNGEHVRALELPTAVKTVKTWAFAGSDLTSVRIPAGVKLLEKNAFSDCQSLTDAIFEKTEGWRYKLSPHATTGTDISSADLRDAPTAATRLTAAYVNYYLENK